MPRETASTAQYTKDLFQDSLLTGIPQIVQTRSLGRKILKSTILASCVIGFVYQTTEFMKIFWSYPTVLDIDVEYPEIIESPAITYCNLNGIKRNSFCEEYPDNCTSPQNITAFCNAFPDVCRKQGIENLKYPKDEAFKFEEIATIDDLKNLGHSSEDILIYCRKMHKDTHEFVECNIQDHIHMPMPDGNTGYRNCYILFSVIRSTTLKQHTLPVPKKTPKRNMVSYYLPTLDIPNTFTGMRPPEQNVNKYPPFEGFHPPQELEKDALFHMVFEMEPGEYFRPDRQVGAIIAIHSPNAIINPFYDGFVIKPGNIYSVHLKVVEEKLLPFPYETQCKDYQSEWKKRNGKGPLSQEMCLAECVYNVSMKLCNCVIPNIMYYHEDRICSGSEMDCFDFNVSQCYTVCQQPCQFTDYEYDVQERKLENNAAQTIEELYAVETNTDHLAIVLIFLKRPEIIIYSHRPQYEDIEVFSFMGGYVGMWLGVSLVAVFDFLESVTLVICYWIHNRISIKKDLKIELG